MSEYIIPIKTAVITFPLIAIIVTLPFLIFQYRKHGYINYFRALILYSFLLFLLTAYYLIILPLPKTRNVLSLQKPGTKYTQFIPFNFVLDILKETKVNISKPSTYIHLFKERAFLQAAFNGILLLPLGVYLRYYFNKSLKKTILITFCVSLFFELTQLSALYGFYNRPYRVFDVDDLMLNTFGGYLGYVVTAAFMKLLPDVKKLDENIQLDKISVGLIRRSIALAFDWFIFCIIAVIFGKHFKAYMFVLVYFIFGTYFTNGRTFGKWLLRIKVIGKNEKLSFKEVFIRYGVLYYAFLGLNYIIATDALIKYVEKSSLNYLLMLLVCLIDLAALIHVTRRFFSSNKELFHDKISGTKLKVI